MMFLRSRQVYDKQVYNEKTWVMLTFLFTFLMAACSSVAPPLTPTGLSDPILQSKGGLVVFEAEQFHGSKARGRHAWVAFDDETASGKVALQARPLSGVNRNQDFVNRSPQLDFQVDFTRAGKHYIWVYGRAVASDIGHTDSVHIGLNGKARPHAERISGPSSTWGWHKKTMGGARASLKVPSKGVHTVNVWMREDGFALDRVVLTTDKAFNPNKLEKAPSEKAKGSFTSTLIAKHSDKCLDVTSASKSKGKNIRQFDCNRTVAQRFTFTPVKDKTDTYTIRNIHSKLCLDIARALRKDGANLVQWTCLGGKNQQFLVKPEKDSTFRLVALHSRKSLDVERASMRSRANVSQWTSHSGDHQKWRLPGFKVVQPPAGRPDKPSAPKPNNPKPNNPEPSNPKPNVPNLPSVKAKMADTFVDSIGINTHIHYTDTVYDDFAGVLKPRLLESGIRHVRDGVYTYRGVNKNTFYYKRIRDLAAAGIRFNLIVPQASRNGPDADLSLLDDIYDWTNRSVEMFEGPNEPDITGVKNWQRATPAFQERLYKAVNSDATLRKVPVVGPSIVRNPQGAGDLSPWLDYGNWHPYPGGICPTCKSAYNSSLDTRLPKHRAPSGNKPMIATETGYHNAVNVEAEEEHKPTSERATGKYLPRLLLEYFNRDVKRTYIYELLDVFPDSSKREREHNFGLVRNDGSPKPAFYAVKNTIGLLADPGRAFKPSTLNYDLTGETKDVHSTLLQKRDGRFFLALWLEKSSWDNGVRANRSDNVRARRDLRVSPQNVTLTLGESMSKVVKHHLQDSGAMSRETLSAKNSLKFEVNDAVTFIELVP